MSVILEVLNFSSWFSIVQCSVKLKHCFSMLYATLKISGLYGTDEDRIRVKALGVKGNE